MPDAMTPQTRRERRWSREAQADRDRRRVRTTNGSKTKRPIVIQVGGPKRKRRRPRVSSKKLGVFAGIWLIFSALFAIAWLTIGGTLWFVGSLLMGLASVMAAIAAFDPDAAVPAAKPKRPATAKPRGNGSPRSRGSSPGTGPRKGSATKPRKRVCSARCQASSKPTSTCNCVCQGKTHGSRKLRAVS